MPGEARAHDDRDEADAERDVRDDDREQRQRLLAEHRDEEDQQRHAEQDLGHRHRREHQERQQPRAGSGASRCRPSCRAPSRAPTTTSAMSSELPRGVQHLRRSRSSLRYQSSVKPTHSALSLRVVEREDARRRRAGCRGRRRPRATAAHSSGDLRTGDPPLARASAAAAAIASTATVSISDSIEPNGQSRVPRKLSLIRLPTSQSSLPPRISGIANMPSTGMNTSAEPEKMPGQRQREGHAPEAVPGVGAQVLRRVEQRRVVLLEVGVERQDHERQVHVDHADDHREAREQQVERAEDDHPGVDAHEEVAGEGQHARAAP